MVFTTSAFVLGLAALGNAHMIMNTPVPYGKSSLNNSPLDAAGADFPCKQRSGVYDAQGASNSMALGSTQPLKFTGSATHGGGSCQISITYDQQPTKSSTFKVIHSIEGGCPIQGVAGNNGESADASDPSTYSFKIPSNIPTGNATLAWTWFNKIGNREMYMNCAPVSLTGSSSKRDVQLEERDQAAFNALPNMFVANIGNGCGTKDSTDVIFPDAGDSVETLAGSTTSALAAPTGSCASAAAGSGSGATTGGSSGATSAVVASSAAVAASTSAASLPGGVFATSAAASAPTVSASSAAAPVASSAAATQASSASTPASTGSTGTTGSGSAIAAGTACTTEGMWNCIGGTSFQQCASGVWSAVQPVAGGTTCTAGQSTSFKVDFATPPKERRAIRFSQDHARRFSPENFHA